ncbi:hypothetical protein BOCO_0767 [Bombiscardovia coagulans]|uniref:Uncharacterized protein n=1 Tax=Bombiscardovia coagulans TaxID=686666 RepID=A0A261ETR5_9BIFI|nr:hypothetical protein BOCO_0767 [Bombiscardovia coagulans]
MRTYNQLFALMRRNNGMRLLLLAVYAILVWQYYAKTMPSSIFVGAFRPAVDSFTPPLVENMYPILFVVCGVALPLEIFSEYLSIPDSLIYIRRRRGPAHFCRYLAILFVYSAVYTGIQVWIAFLVIPDCNAKTLLSTSLCAQFTLILLMLVSNFGYLLDNRAAGYISALVLYGLVLCLNPLLRWLIQDAVYLPHWVPVYGVLALVLIAANAFAFSRLQII